MAYLNPRVADLGLNVLDTEADVLHICSAAPSDYADTLTKSLGTKTSLSVGSPANATPNGREVTVPAIADGSVSSSGNATHVAIVDSVNSRLLAWQSLGATVAVTISEVFTLPSFKIRLADPA